MQRHLSHLAHMICRVTHFEFCIFHQLVGFGLELPQAQLIDVLSKLLPEDYESNSHHVASFCTSPLTNGRNTRLRCERTNRLGVSRRTYLLQLSHLTLQLLHFSLKASYARGCPQGSLWTQGGVVRILKTAQLVLQRSHLLAEGAILPFDMLTLFQCSFEQSLMQTRRRETTAKTQVVSPMHKPRERAQCWNVWSLPALVR